MADDDDQESGEAVPPEPAAVAPGAPEGIVGLLRDIAGPESVSLIATNAAARTWDTGATSEQVLADLVALQDAERARIRDRLDAAATTFMTRQLDEVDQHGLATYAQMRSFQFAPLGDLVDALQIPMGGIMVPWEKSLPPAA